MRVLPLVLSVLLATTTTAQVVQVTNTGCPNSGYPQTSSAARIGQSFDIVHLCRAPDTAFCLFGYASGNRIPFDVPLTCIAGPCNLYVAPIVMLPSGAIGRWSLPIPNDRRLVTQTYAIQTGCLSVARSCFTMAGAVSFAIQP